MKLKQKPEDFEVTELAELSLGDSGEFALYELEKIGWTTLDALAVIRRRWSMDRRRVSYGGLKDRHALTRQYVTILHGPRRDLHHQRLHLRYLGRTAEPFGPAMIRGNRFHITLRDLTPVEAQAIATAITEIQAAGLPNYFDDQRFGSVTPQREFIAREMLLGRFDRALWLALAAPYEFDRAADKRLKATLRQHWNDWPTCKAQLPRSHARSIVDYLIVHPQDYRGAIARLRPELLSLYLAAYQSDLWNRILCRWLAQCFAPADLATLRLKHRTLLAPRRSLAHPCTLTFPLPSARVKPGPEYADWLPLAEEVLREDGLTLAQMQVKGLRKPYFAKGDRFAFVSPDHLTLTQEADDLHPGRLKCHLHFDLPRGSYATILIKRLQAREARSPVEQGHGSDTPVSPTSPLTQE